MFNSYKTALITTIREKTLLIWALAFPIILATFFMVVFGNFDSMNKLTHANVGIVEDAAYRQAPGLSTVIETISKDDGERSALMTPHTFFSEEEAIKAAHNGVIDAYITVDSKTLNPQLHVNPSINNESSDGAIKKDILETVLNSYIQKRDAVFTAMQDDPQLIEAFRNSSTAELSQNQATQIQAIIERFQNDAVQTVRLEATKNAPDPNVRYFYALLAMTAGMGMMVAAYQIQIIQSNTSALGARRCMASIPRWRVLAGSLLASWTCEFVCGSLAFLYMLMVAKVNFGDQVGWCVVALAVSTLAFTALGAFLGTIIKKEASGILSGISCFLSLFVGLYGSANMRFAATLEVNAPLLVRLNPLWHVYHCFYSLLYYKTLDSFVESCLVLLAIAVMSTCFAALRMRRTAHVHL